MRPNTVIISVFLIFLFTSCAFKTPQTQDISANEQPATDYEFSPQEQNISASEQPATDYEFLLRDLENPRIIDESQYHRIYYGDNFYFVYIIFDENGEIVETEQYEREPTITVQDNKLITVSLQAGTGIETRWTYYYDIEKDVLSRVFYGVFDQIDEEIIYINNYNSIAVRNIFDKTKLFKTFDNFKELSENSATPFVDAEFIENGQKISITYFNNNYDNITEVFDLK